MIMRCEHVQKRSCVKSVQCQSGEEQVSLFGGYLFSTHFISQSRCGQETQKGPKYAPVNGQRQTRDVSRRFGKKVLRRGKGA